MWDTLLDGNFHLFGAFFHLLSIARLAFSALADNLSLALTFVAGLLNLLIHSWSHLEHLDDLPPSFTFSAFVDVLSSFSLAVSADSSSLVIDFHQISVINVLEGHFQSLFGRFDLGHLFFA